MIKLTLIATAAAAVLSSSAASQIQPRLPPVDRSVQLPEPQSVRQLPQELTRLIPGLTNEAPDLYECEVYMLYHAIDGFAFTCWDRELGERFLMTFNTAGRPGGASSALDLLLQMRSRTNGRAIGVRHVAAEPEDARICEQVGPFSFHPPYDRLECRKVVSFGGWLPIN
jgi:hypothetical protein